MNNSKDFQVGDLVIAPRLFEGALPIYRIISTDAYPISVEDKDGCRYMFTVDGKENEMCCLVSSMPEQKSPSKKLIRKDGPG